jgi:hypothetical protein
VVAIHSVVTVVAYIHSFVHCISTMKAFHLQVFTAVLQGVSVVAEEVPVSDSAEDHRQLPRSKRCKF